MSGKNKKIGLMLLRTIACFCVVLIHYWRDESCSSILSLLHQITGYAVPVFMFMSFYLTQNGFLRKDKTYIKSRLWRLIWPQIGWTVIYCVVYFIIDLMFKTDKIHVGSEFFWQLFTGHSPRINSAMWYQIVIFLISLVFFAVFYFLPVKIGLYIILSFALFALVLQYSGINYSFFGELRYELKYPLGRICEMIPLAVLGFLTSYFGIYRRFLKDRRLRFVSVVSLAGCSYWMHKMIGFIPEGFGYSGISKLVVAFSVIAIAVVLPLEGLPPIYKKIIELISKYTLAVYCMHNMIGRFMISMFNKIGLEPGTFFMCLVIYVVCYILAFFIARIPMKLCKQLVE